jgi:UDP-3-O-[3-hydroxymyristoyl] glucosamine N-acyltransferase
MNMTLSFICKEVGLDFNGDDIDVSSLNTLADATSEQLSFLDNPKYVDALTATNAGAVLVHPKQAELVPSHTVAIVTEEPYLLLAHVSKLFAPKPIEIDGKEPIIANNTLISKNAYIGFGAIIGENATIMPGAFIGDNVVIGANTIIYANSTIYRDCKIGKNCIIHANTVIGSDGFGFAHTKTGEHIKIYQNGYVELEDDVEVGSNSSIDRGVFGPTLVKKGTKIDNLVQIGHNAEIGEGSIIVAQSGIAGSTKVGHHCVFGAQSGVSGHLEIAAMTTCVARTGLMGNIKEEGQTYAGFPHMPHRLWLKMNAKMKSLIKKAK